MHPIFIRTPWLVIHTYGVLVAAGFLIGLAVAARNVKREGLPPEAVADLGVWLIVAGMASAKLFYIVFFWNDFLAGWQAEGLRSLREGFVFYGGFIGASMAAVVFTRLRRLSLWKMADCCAPGGGDWPRFREDGLLLQRVLLRKGLLAGLGRPIPAAASDGRNPGASNGDL